MAFIKGEEEEAVSTTTTTTNNNNSNAVLGSLFLTGEDETTRFNPINETYSEISFVGNVTIMPPNATATTINATKNDQGTKQSNCKQTFRIRNKNSSKCSKRCRQVRQTLKVKRRQKEEAMHIEDIQRLVTEIEMLKVVLYLVSRRKVPAPPLFS